MMLMVLASDKVSPAVFVAHQLAGGEYCQEQKSCEFLAGW